MTSATILGVLGVLTVLAVGVLAAPDVLSATQCSEDKLPITSPSTRVACVTESTYYKLLERGWTGIQKATTNEIPMTGNLPGEDKTSKNPNTDQIEYWEKKDFEGLFDDVVSTPPGRVPNFGFPEINYSIPRIIPIDQKLVIPLTLDYSPQGDRVFDPSKSTNTYYELIDGRVHEIKDPYSYFPVGVLHTNHLKYVGEYEIFKFSNKTDIYGEGIHEYILKVPYEDDHLQATTLEFEVTSPMLYDQEIFYLSILGIFGPEKYWYTSTNNGQLTLSPTSLYATGQSEEYPDRGNWVGSGGTRQHDPEPGTGPVTSASQLANLPEDLRNEILEWMKKNNYTFPDDV